MVLGSVGNNPTSALARRNAWINAQAGLSRKGSARVVKARISPEAPKTVDEIRKSISQGRESSVVVSEPTPPRTVLPLEDIDLSPQSPEFARVAGTVVEVAETVFREEPRSNAFCRTASVNPFMQQEVVRPSELPEQPVSVARSSTPLSMPLGKPPLSPVIKRVPDFVTRLYPKSAPVSRSSSLQRIELENSKGSIASSVVKRSGIASKPQPKPASRTPSVEKGKVAPSTIRISRIPLRSISPPVQKKDSSLLRKSSAPTQPVARSSSVPKKEATPSFVERLYRVKPPVKEISRTPSPVSSRPVSRTSAELEIAKLRKKIAALSQAQGKSRDMAVQTSARKEAPGSARSDRPRSVSFQETPKK